MPDMGTIQSREPRQSGAARFSSIRSYDFNTKRIQIKALWKWSAFKIRENSNSYTV